jgi:adenylate kinase
MNVIILGPPGSGKTTQGNLLARRLGGCTIATGDLLADAVQGDTELGRQAKEYMDRGEMVPDEIILSLVKQQLEAPDAQEGAVLDGFPRTVRQGQAVNKMLAARGKRVKGAVLLDVPEEELVQRLLAKASADQRSGEDTEAIQKRLAAYRTSNAPLVGYYRELGVLKIVTGTGSVEEVAESVKRAIGG